MVYLVDFAPLAVYVQVRILVVKIKMEFAGIFFVMIFMITVVLFYIYIRCPSGYGAYGQFCSSSCGCQASGTVCSGGSCM